MSILFYVRTHQHYISIMVRIGKSIKFLYNILMSFSLSALIVGFIILATGGACVVFYQQIADNVAHGVNSYDHVKLFGIIAIAIGFLVMTNLHSVVLGWLVGLIFPNANKK